MAATTRYHPVGGPVDSHGDHDHDGQDGQDVFESIGQSIGEHGHSVGLSDAWVIGRRLNRRLRATRRSPRRTGMGARSRPVTPSDGRQTRIVVAGADLVPLPDDEDGVRVFGGGLTTQRARLASERTVGQRPDGPAVCIAMAAATRHIPLYMAVPYPAIGGPWDL